MNVSFRFLLAAALSTGVGLVLVPTAHAQRTDSTSTVKPQLNTAPPGTVPRPTAPAPRPQDQAVPVPAPAPANAPLPAPQPSSDSPSGLDFPAGSRASEQPKPLRKYFLYTNFGLGYSSFYGDGQFNASIAPALGIRLNERLSVGPGLSYSYNNVSYSDINQQVYGYPPSVTANNVGLKAFAQYMVYKQFFVHAEYEVTRTNVRYTYQGQQYSFGQTLRTPLAGVGYRNEFSDRVALDIVGLYNFNNGINPDGTSTSPYGQPEIRLNLLINLGK